MNLPKDLGAALRTEESAYGERSIMAMDLSLAEMSVRKGFLHGS